MSASGAVLVKKASAQDVHKLLGSTSARIVDVRLPYDYFGGRIPGSQNMPGNYIRETAGQVPSNTPLVFVCDDGSVSEEVARVAQAAGFTDVSVLDGGFNSWLAAGFPTETITDGFGAPPPPAGAGR